MRNNESGQSMVETALLLPVLLLLLVGILDFGRFLYSYSHLNMAAQETVRVGGLGGSDSEIIEFAHNYVHLGDAANLDVNITPKELDRHSGDYMTVDLKYPFQLYTPFLSHLFPSLLWIETDSTIRVE
ncbi:TadE/TadG family type IV pilus assembly protein [Neobacillus sp. D3-1R]|uniref:TadE/TadG family type IV pilus assembly protein n=1 Tax=Neobacillus sp. D3-1R TaxID=3445778 RepID=UPI003F9F7A30